MYGITGLNLDEIIGSEVQQICCGCYDVQFHFQSGTRIGGQGDITLLDRTGEIGCWTEGANWSSLVFQKLLNIKVTNYSVPNDQLLQIEFDNCLVLQMHDSSDRYESFMITKPDGAMIVV